MAVAGDPPQESECGNIGSEGFTATTLLDILGIPVDAGLSLRPLLDSVCGKLYAGTRRLVAGMADCGFGVPVQVMQFPARVESAALYGAELLASHEAGWGAVQQRLNRAYYEVAKMIVAGAVQPWSLGKGGQSRVFLEARLATRLGTKLARRILSARARLLLLPRPSPLSEVLEAVALSPSARTWVRDAEEVGRSVGVTEWPEPDPLATPDRRRTVAQEWMRRVVDPVLEALEARWFAEQVGKLADDGLVPLHVLPPLRQPWPATVAWAPWGRTMRRYHRACMVARLTLRIPVVAWGVAAEPSLSDPCALCGQGQATLHHLLAECAAVAGPREDVWATFGEDAFEDGILAWALGESGGPGMLEDKVRFVGLLSGAFVHALTHACPE